MADDQDKTAREHGARTMRQGVPIRTGRKYSFKVKKRRLENARWSRTDCLVSDEVELAVDVKTDDPEVVFRIFEGDADGADDFVVELKAPAQEQQARVRWTVPYVEDLDDDDSARQRAEKGYTLPEFYFIASAGEHTTDSGKSREAMLKVLDVLDTVLVDPQGAPLGDTPYTVQLADGTSRAGRSAADGRVREENVPPGAYALEVGGEDDFEDLDGEAA